MVNSAWDALILLVGYLLATFGAGWLVDRIVPEPKQTPPRLPVIARVPLLIGWFERFLIVTFVLLGEMTAVGFIVLAKTIVRFGETRDDREYAEYFLCGTLVSFSIGLGLAVLLRWLLQQA